MLKKMVDGIEIICSEQEEAAFRAYWDLNDQYPQYYDAFQFDGVSMPVTNMQRAKELHMLHVKKWVDEKIKSLSEEIQKAQENNDTKLIANLYFQRKSARAILDTDLTQVNTVADLKALLPS